MAISTQTPSVSPPPHAPVVTPFDLIGSYAKIQELAGVSDFRALAFRVAQAAIVATRRGEPVAPGIITLLAQVIVFCSKKDINIGAIAQMLRAYHSIRKRVEVEIMEVIGAEPIASRELLVKELAVKMIRFGFAVTYNQSSFSFSDLTHLPYPISAGGRPYIHTVWLEATSHCNQKCTFCPDPKRESKREFSDFEEFKKRASELSANFNIGYWQLNAFGEPLLHPKIYDMVRFIRHELKSPAPVYFTTHGLTLTAKRIALLVDNALPTEVMISLHNDSQESYGISRNNKIGDYETLVNCVYAFCKALIDGSHNCSVRMSVLVNNSRADKRVQADILSAFADNPERFYRLVEDWRERFRPLTSERGMEVFVPMIDRGIIENLFNTCDHGPDHIVPIVQWKNLDGGISAVNISPRPVASYANQLLHQHDPDSVVWREAAPYGCGFTNSPSLGIFANGTLGICCIDLETTANFGKAVDHPTIIDSLKSDQCNQMFANLAFGIPDSKGCSICLGDTQK